jgi:argininosuccinate lyase
MTQIRHVMLPRSVLRRYAASFSTRDKHYQPGVLQLDERHDFGVDTGRLNTALTDEAQQIVYGRYKPDRTDELGSELLVISEIDRAHLIMLVEEEIADVARARLILQQIEALRSSRFSALRQRPIPRGLYLAYESHVSEVLGDEVGGIIHTGRSRNDLNATTLKLRARAPYAALVTAASRLCDALLTGAEHHRETIMPAYTHGQAAVPVTYGHYLSALACSITRSIENLLQAGEELETNPLGAGAAGGTSIAINAWRTTQLLGFTRPAANSIDAVASRDFVLRMLSAAAILGVGLTRAARDFGTWSTEEFGFLHMPDDLVGSSSMMPQKRNPFLLEHVQGKAAGCLGSFVGAVSAMSTAAYTNAIAVGTDGVTHLWPGLQNITEAIELFRLVVEGAVPVEGRMLDRADIGNTVATYLAELLVQRGVAFRTAHYQVGKLVSAALVSQQPLSAVAAESLGEVLTGTVMDAEWLTPSTVVKGAKYGGGPGAATAPEMLGELRLDLLRLRKALSERRERWEKGRLLLDEAVRRITSGQ